MAKTHFSKIFIYFTFTFLVELRGLSPFLKRNTFTDIPLKYSSFQHLQVHARRKDDNSCYRTSFCALKCVSITGPRTPGPPCYSPLYRTYLDRYSSEIFITSQIFHPRFWLVTISDHYCSQKPVTQSQPPFPLELTLSRLLLPPLSLQLPLCKIEFRADLPVAVVVFMMIDE